MRTRTGFRLFRPLPAGKDEGAGSRTAASAPTTWMKVDSRINGKKPVLDIAWTNFPGLTGRHQGYTKSRNPLYL